MPQPKIGRKVGVVTGARGVGSLATAEYGDDSAAKFGQFLPPGQKGYRSKYRFLRVQITSPQHTVNPVTGEVTKINGKTAQFDENFFSTDDPEIIAKLDRLSEDKKHGRNFWPLDKEIAEETARREREARRWLKENADLARKVLEELQGDKFPVEAAPEA